MAETTRLSDEELNKRWAGRPTVYSEEVLKNTIEYVRKPYPCTDFLGDEEEFPTKEGLAVFLGVHKDTLYQWAKDPDKKAFSDVFAELMHRQGKILITKGSNSKFNSTITKLMLTKHDYRDESFAEQHVTGDVLSPEHKAMLDKLGKKDEPNHDGQH